MKAVVVVVYNMSEKPVGVVCPLLSVASCGDTKEEAKRMIIEAINGRIEEHPPHPGVFGGDANAVSLEIKEILSEALLLPDPIELVIETVEIDI